MTLEESTLLTDNKMSDKAQPSFNIASYDLKDGDFVLLPSLLLSLDAWMWRFCDN